MKNSETHSVCNKHNIGDKSVCCECTGKTDCSDSSKTTDSEDWEVELEDLLDASAGLTAASKTLRVALKVFSAKLRTAAYESALREALEAIPNEEEPAKRLNTFKEGFKSGWNLHAEQSIRAITARLLDT